jgi:hypothetical protein
MMNRKKKILGSLMLFVVAAPVIFFTAYLVKQKLIQHKMAERLEASALITISINQVDLKWEKEGSEAIVHGELFDVKSYTFKDGKIMLTGLYDTAENKLQKQFAGLLRQQKDKSTPLEKLILKYIFSTAINKNTASISFFVNDIDTTYPSYNEVAVCQFLKINTAPPNV